MEGERMGIFMMVGHLLHLIGDIGFNPLVLSIYFLQLAGFSEHGGG